MYQVFPYTKALANEWDSIVDESANGTFQLRSGYMDYHRHRFHDASVLVADGKGKIQGAFPAAYEQDGTVVSHPGLTYGGLLTSAKAHATDVLQTFGSVCAFYSAKGCNRLIYKAIPHIYNEQMAEADLYGLAQHQAQLYRRTLSSAVNLEAPLPFSELRRRGVAKALRNGIVVSQSSDYESFWMILETVLNRRYHVSPVHTLSEIRHLSALYPTNIRLYTASVGAEMLAGVLIYASRGVAHAQYIAANEYGKSVGALDLVFSRLIAEYQQESYRWLDFGISTSHDGSELSKGLLMQKEGFGARSVCYDTYILNL